MKITIDSRTAKDRLLPPADQKTVKSEPMLLMANRTFAMRHGGPLTHVFLDNLVGWDDIVVDSRVHMLMPGMWPCIPGWHHDDVPRTREDKQPNYESPAYRSEHCMALWGSVSPTEFAIGPAEFEIPPIGQKIYKTWNAQVEQLCEDGVLQRHAAPEHRMIFFDCNTWHRGVEAKHTAFRFFIRATRNTGLVPKNEIRINANVYMPVLTEGW